MLGDLHLVSPETEKVGQLVSVIKRRGMAVSESWESFAIASTVWLLWLLCLLLTSLDIVVSVWG